MLLLTGVLLFCGAVIALVWAYEVNRREPKPRWARIEMIWETLLATVIGVAMVGLLLVLKYALRLEGLATVAPLEFLGAAGAIVATVALAWYLLRPLRAARRAVAAARPAAQVQSFGGQTTDGQTTDGQTTDGQTTDGPTQRPSGAGARPGPARRKAA
jgi:multisubunit Na+/H+ antiporter MnhB subunit